VPPDFDPATIYTRDYFQGGQRDGYADYQGSDKERAVEFRKLLEDLSSAGIGSGKLLEVGCAYGYFLDEARESFQVSGIELSEDAVADCRARGLDVVRYPVPSFFAERGPFDVVVMLDVLEHLVDPGLLLLELHRHTRPGAAIVLTTGDFGSLMSRALGRQWRLMTPPQHLWYFTKESIEKLLGRSGFRLVELTYPTKRVPVGLVAYQIARYFGLQSLTRRWRLPGTIPINLHDAMRVLARRA
jgi:SAM-dependent methyltransferase